MNRGVYQFHLKRVAERKELLEKLKHLIANHQIKTESELLSYLAEAGVQTDVQTMTRELQGLKVTRTTDGMYVLPVERELQERKRQVEEVMNRYAADVCDKVAFLTIKTLKGHEERVASVIENGFGERILGTVIGRGLVFVIAQDDTVGNEALHGIRALG